MLRQIPRLPHRASPRSSFPLLAASLLALSCLPVDAQDTTLSSQKRAQIEKAVSAFMTANSVPGISVAVLQAAADRSSPKTTIFTSLTAKRVPARRQFTSGGSSYVLFRQK
jgi:hypothetical protein